MTDHEAPAPAEGTEQALPAGGDVAPQAAPTEQPAEQQQPGESDAQHRRRLIEAARIEKRTRAERAAAEKARQEAEQSAARVTEWQAQAKQLQEQLQRFEQYKQNAIRNPRAVMQELGLDLDTIVRAHLEEDPTPDVLVRDVERKSRAELEALRNELAEIKRQQQEREQRAQEAQSQQAVRAIQQEIVEHLRSDPDKYELTMALEQEGEVFELMRLAYQRDGTVLPVGKAAEMIEDFLANQAKKAASAKKIAALFKPQETPAAPAKATQAKQVTDAREPKASTTLTSKLATSPAQPQVDETLDIETLAKRAAERVRAAKDAKRAK